jgi:hypothetical protein
MDWIGIKDSFDLFEETGDTIISWQVSLRGRRRTVRKSERVPKIIWSS